MERERHERRPPDDASGSPFTCSECGYSYDVDRAEIAPWMRSAARAFVDRFQAFDGTSVRGRPEPDVWSPLEYACHVRDVLRVNHARIELAQREYEPVFAPMRRDERVVEDGYNEQDPQHVGRELVGAAEAFAASLDGFDDDGWQRRGVYNYPTPQLRTVEWIGIHTVHELVHHRNDIAPINPG